MIVGLPGDPLQSHLDGLDPIMDLFPRPAVFVYNCGVFVNAPMNEPQYVKEHGIKVIKSPIYLWHSSIHNRGDIPEYENITVGANTFTTYDLKKVYLHGWTSTACQRLGIFEV